MRRFGGLFKREGARFWYFYFWDGDGRKRRRVTLSTGRTNKNKAKERALEYFRELEEADKARAAAPPVPALRDFAATFFQWGECSWIATRHRQGFRFSEDTAAGRRGHLVNHILKRFGDLPLDKITRGDVREWLAGLKVENQSRNHVLNTFRIVLRSAAHKELIPVNPLEGKDMQFRVNAKRRDVFALEEIQTLFPTDEAKLVAIWKYPKYATAFLVLASTGIRSGELRALVWSDVLWEYRALHISRAAKESGRIGGLKTATPMNPDDRVVLLPARTLATLQWWHGKTPHKALQNIVFFGDTPDRPMNRRTLSEHLGPCLERAEIRHAGRTLTPHSFRHGYVSAARREMPQATL